MIPHWAVTYDGPTMTMNAVMSKHWRSRQAHMKPVVEAGVVLARALPRPFGFPVHITAHHFYKGRTPDVAAILPTVKGLIDGFTEAECWPDDDPAHVARLTFAPPVHDLKHPRIELIITEEQ